MFQNAKYRLLGILWVASVSVISIFLLLDDAPAVSLAIASIAMPVTACLVVLHVRMGSEQRRLEKLLVERDATRKETCFLN